MHGEDVARRHQSADAWHCDVGNNHVGHVCIHCCYQSLSILHRVDVVVAKQGSKVFSHPTMILGKSETYFVASVSLGLSMGLGFTGSMLRAQAGWRIGETPGVTAWKSRG